MHLSYKHTRLAGYIGYITQAISINLAPLFFIIFQDRYAITYSRLGQLVLLTFVIQLSVDFLSIRLLEKIGYRAAAIAAHVLAAVGLILLGVLPPLFADPYLGILVAVFFYSMGGGMTEVVISPLIDAIPGDAKAASMSLLHSFYSWGQCLVVLVTTVLLRFVGDGLWGLLPCLWALIPLADMILFCFVPIPPMTEEKQTGNRLSDLLCKPLFYLFILLMICGGAAEMTMSQWASLFAEKALGVSKVTGDILGPCFFGVLMGLGRVGYGLWGHKYRIAPALFGCSVLTLACYLLSVFGGLPVFSLIGCGFCGLGVSLMWPGVLSLSSGEYPRAGAPMFAVLALAGDLGCSLGPWLSGIVTDLAKAPGAMHMAGIAGDAEQIAMKHGMLVAVVFPFIMTAVLGIYLWREKNRTKTKKSK